MMTNVPKVKRTADEQHEADIALIVEAAKEYGVEVEPSVSLLVTFHRIMYCAQYELRAIAMQQPAKKVGP